ncbi:hypothetical protein HC031_01560 [Planosporangium thailandense]|uniref:CdiI immunity protein domain-containing protein n=1 Tax=Planosporangium thailandense TaxID=765197 RepID=A0ABX0XQZ8_9ACTN|nr:contact-dependent growth inhibition system immunity protein [Planosporangium thailandense]NJC68415.1 hypothetical protein [Planosporangium thailandense]
MYDTIVNLARSYYHQDFSLMAHSPEGVLRSFCAQESPRTVADLRQELVDLLRGPDPEETFKQVWSTDGHSSYVPPLHGVGYLEWAHRMVQVVDEYTASRD